MIYNSSMNPIEQKDNKRRLIFGTATFVVILIVLFVVIKSSGMTWRDLIDYTPSNKILAGLVMEVFYAIKSLTIFFPIPVLQLAAGHLFPMGWAIFINLVGVIVACSIPYWLGKIIGPKYVDALIERFEKIEKIKTLHTNNTFFSTFLMRTLQLPMDLVSLFIGSVDKNYGAYLLGSFLGMAPLTIAVTLLGETITDPSNPKFWIMCIVILIVMALSLVGFKAYLKHQAKVQK